MDIAVVFVMVGLVPTIRNDVVLTAVYAAIVAAMFAIQWRRKDLIVFVFGLFVMTCMEYLFVTTGVETFLRHSLFGVMPLWLPVLWGYGFVVIRRTAALIAEP